MAEQDAHVDVAAFNTAAAQNRGFITAWKRQSAEAKEDTEEFMTHLTKDTHDTALLSTEKAKATANSLVSNYEEVARTDKPSNKEANMKKAEQMAKSRSIIKKNFNSANAKYEEKMARRQREEVAAEAAATAKATFEAQQAAGITQPVNVKPPIASPASTTHIEDRTIIPSKLDWDSTLEEYEAWREDITDYCNNNLVETRTPEKQMSVIRTYLNDNIRGRIKIRIDQSDPSRIKQIFATGGMMEIIAAEIHARNPEFNMRILWYEFEGHKGEDLEEWIDRIHNAHYRAKVVNMSSEDHMVFKAITSCPDEKLRKKLREMTEDKKTWKEIRAKTTEYVANKIKGDAAEEEAKATVKAVKAKKKPRKSNGGPKPSGNYLSPADIDGLCFSCGAKGHTSKDCRKKESAKCTKCDRDGHVAEVCLTDYNRANGRAPKTEKKEEAVARAVQVEETE